MTDPVPAWVYIPELRAPGTDDEPWRVAARRAMAPADARERRVRLLVLAASAAAASVALLLARRARR